MMDEAWVALAAVARRQGSAALERPTWVHVLSLELGWMTPGEARAYVGAAVAAGLLDEEGGALRLARDPATIAAPLGFRPDPQRLPSAAAASPERADDPFLAHVDRLAGARRVAREAVLGDVASLQDRMGGLLDAEGAVLLLSAQAGLDVRDVAGQSITRRQQGAAAPAPAARP